MASSLTYSNAELLAILRATRSIAMVGASPKWNRPSYFAMKYLQEKGYRVIPVNPGHAGKEILGETVYRKVAEVPGDVDLVILFRRSADVPAHVDDIIEKRPKAVWMQSGIRNPEAAQRFADAGIDVVQDRCTMVEHRAIA